MATIRRHTASPEHDEPVPVTAQAHPVHGSRVPLMGLPDTGNATPLMGPSDTGDATPLMGPSDADVATAPTTA